MQIENVKVGEVRMITQHEFEQFQAGELRFDCDGVRMKPRKIKNDFLPIVFGEWYARMEEWPEIGR